MDFLVTQNECQVRHLQYQYLQYTGVNNGQYASFVQIQNHGVSLSQPQILLIQSVFLVENKNENFYNILTVLVFNQI